MNPPNKKTSFDLQFQAPSLKTALLAVAVLLTATFGSQAAVILNGDFDTDGPAGNSFLVNTPPTGWTLGAVNEYWVGGTVFGPAAQSGNNFVALQSLNNGLASMFSSVSGLDIGTTYEVSFYTFGGVQFGYQADTFWIFALADTNGANFVTLNTGNNASTTTWEIQTASFVADATEKNIYFLAGASVHGAGMYFDSASIAAVPEPATFSLIGISVVAFCLLSRGRRSDKQA